MFYDIGDCQNYGPFLGSYYNTGPNTGPNLGDPKRDHSFDNPPYDAHCVGSWVLQRTNSTWGTVKTMVPFWVP